jgi:DNA-directed RNA polymerase subunit M/transcription elongation factor TFIIS
MLPFDISDLTDVPLLYYYGKYEKIRFQTFLVISGFLGQYKEFKSKPRIERQQIIAEIERGINNAVCDKCEEKKICPIKNTPEYNAVYLAVSYFVTSNIDINLSANQEFTKKIISGEIVLSEIASMYFTNMSPSRYVKTMEHINLARSSQMHKKISTIYKCKKCHSNVCSVRSVTNRSLDEGTNLRVDCGNCGNFWFT